MIYKNISNTSQIFYGVNFAPGDTKEVPGYINSPGFIHKRMLPRVYKAAPKKPEIKDTAQVNEIEIQDNQEEL